jgi:hypothetical protein
MIDVRLYSSLSETRLRPDTIEYLLDKDGNDDGRSFSEHLHVEKSAFFFTSARLGRPCLKACGVGALGVWGGVPAWAQVTQAGTPIAEDPTVDVDDAWREGRASGSEWNAVVGAGLRLAPDYEGGIN